VATDSTLTLENIARGDTRGGTMRYAPYWWDAAPRPSGEAKLPSSVDVAIVGSGFTGLSAALTLLKGGRSALVLDRDVPGFGASTRNGGQIGSGNQKFSVAKLMALRGRKKAEDMLREGTRMLQYIEHLIIEEKIACHFNRCGRFRGAMRPEHYDAMARELTALKEIAGVEGVMVPKAEQNSEIGSDLFYGGSVLPNDASLHPGLYHAGLMRRIAERGGSIAGNAAVTGVTASGNGFVVTTARGDMSCRNVIIASNGYTDGLVPELKRRIVPIGSALIATGPIDQNVFAKLLPKQRVYGNTNRVFYYYRGAPGEPRLIWGGRASHVADSQTPLAYRHLARDVLNVFPQLAETPVTHGWDGKIGYTFDEVPHLGKTSGGVHYALGYCGTGVSRSTYFGNKIALQVLGKSDGRTAFDDLTFPAFPAHPVAKHMVPVVETLYRARDVTGL
jgi:glycine/D-amino acid oxidase-like deaminating enzyme